MDELTFTLTYIKDGDDSKILVAHGDVPAKVDSEADATIAKSVLPSTFDAIEKAIPNWREAEDGCEESLTHSVQEFLDIYELDLLKIFEDAEEEGTEAPAKEDSDGESTEVVCEDDPEFDYDVFGGKAKEMSEPNDIFMIKFGPENLQSAMSKLDL